MNFTDSEILEKLKRSNAARALQGAGVERKQAEAIAELLCQYDSYGNPVGLQTEYLCKPCD